MLGLTHPALGRPHYRDAVIAARPTYYWPCNEMSGTIARDLKGVSNATFAGGAQQGAPGPPGIRDGASYRLAGGSTTYVDCGALAINQSAYSMMAWFYLTSAQADRNVIGRWDGAGGAMIYLASSTGRYNHVHSATGGNWITTTIVPVLNRWHHVAITWDGATLNLYEDGLNIGTKSMATAPGNPSTNFFMGAYNVSRLFTGSLCEGAYWAGRAITAGEVAHLNTLGR